MPSPEPGRVIGFRPPSFALEAADPSSATVQVVNSSDSDSTPLGVAYPYPTLAVITGSGSATINYSMDSRWDTLAGLTHHDSPMTYRGLGGGSIMWANLDFRFYLNGSLSQGGRFTTAHAGPDTLKVQGQGYAIYNRGAPYYTSWCSVPGVHCFLYSGAYTLEVDPIPADMSLDEWNTTIVKNVGWQYAQFTIVNTPAIVQADYSLTVDIVWTWVADSGTSASVAGCAGSRTCPTQNPTVSGTMTADAIVNGVAKQVTKRVNVLACVTGDSLLDDARVRRGLKKMWDASGATGPESGRMERLGGLFDSGRGVLVDSLLPVLTGANACRAYGPNVSVPWPYTGPRVWWHPHPFKPGDWLPDPPLCDTGKPLAPGTRRRLGTGPSKGDLDGQGGIPMIIVDAENVYVTDPTGEYTTHPRSSCDPLQ